MNKIIEKGPFRGRRRKTMNFGTKIVIDSDDSTHDASLEVHGGFETDQQLLDYAREIARRLNQWQEEHGDDRI